MTGTRCTVATCTNSLEKTRREDKNIKYHRFPANPDLRKVWVQKCRRDGKWNPKSCHICSVHFTNDDYGRVMQNELLGLPIKRKLKSTAVPTMNLPKSAEVPATSSIRQERIERREMKRVVSTLLNKLSSSDDQPVDIPLEISESTRSINSDEKYEDLLKKYKQLLQEQCESRRQLSLNGELLVESKIKIKSLEKELAKTKLELDTEKCFHTKIETALSSFLSKSQLDIVLGKKKKIIWTSEDISKAFAIRYFSRRCYIYLRETLKYPLPGISPLQRWASRLDLHQGLLVDVLRFLEIGGHDLSEFEKVCVIQFDEVKVKSTYEYDRKADEVVGPHSQMQVVLIRGLFSRWKQPIYIGFDKKMTKDILLDIISKLSVISYRVVACVSDCGDGNIALWNELDISKNRSYFKHPLTNENIYYFPDAPHLLKLVRNWLLDNGFTLPDGAKVSMEPLKHLINSTDTEINSYHRLTKCHIECVGVQRQNVTQATQLLSHTTAMALLKYQPGPDKKLAKDTGLFLEQINNWFDVMNSYTSATSIVKKRAYGLHLDVQDTILKKLVF